MLTPTRQYNLFRNHTLDLMRNRMQLLDTRIVRKPDQSATKDQEKGLTHRLDHLHVVDAIKPQTVIRNDASSHQYSVSRLRLERTERRNQHHQR